MRPPQSVWSLYAFAFGLIGAIFVFLGAIFFITRFPVSGAPDGFFLLTGASFLLVSICCLTKSRLQGRRIKRLKMEGVPVAGNIQSVQPVIWINWRNTRTFFNWPGQCSPWVVRCSYCYGGRTYTVKSALSWLKQAAAFQQPVIYLDPRHPARAYVDMDTIRWEL